MMKKTFWVLFLYLIVSLSFGGTTFLHQYEHPGEVITKINTVRFSDGGCVFESKIVLALEGYYPQTNEFFSRIQSLDMDGNLLDEYEGAYVGEPLHLGSGLFETIFYPMLITPVIDELPLNQFRLHWQTQYPDSAGTHDYYERILPDSMDTIVEFPNALNKYRDSIYGGDINLVGGRAIVNGHYTCFAVKAIGWEPEPSPILYFPTLEHISSLGGMDSYYHEGYLAVGKANGWTGKIILVDRDGAVQWQQNFTDGCDATQTPMFTTPLLSNREDWDDRFALSYQNKDRMMHIDLYDNMALLPVYSEQLDAYTGAIPICFYHDKVTFAYLKNGVQIIKQIDLNGNTIWTRMLPGIGSFGKSSLTLSYIYQSGQMTFVLAGRMAGGGYYVAQMNVEDGSIRNDVVSQPENLKLSLYPNPCDDVLKVSFELKQPGKVRLELYNLKGQNVASLKNAEYPKGKFIEDCNLSVLHNTNFPSGVYLLRLEQNGRQITRKLFYQHRHYEPLAPPAKH